MKREKYFALEKAAQDFCKVRYTGCRQIRDESNRLLKEAIHNERERKGNSKYFVYERRINHGTRNYPDIEAALIYESLDNFNETDKMFVSKSGHTRVDKEKIVAWLS